MKKILGGILVLIILVGGYYWYQNQDDVSIMDQNLEEKSNMEGVVNTPEEEKENGVEEDVVEPEKVVNEIDQLDQEEDEVDQMIDELEELKF